MERKTGISESAGRFLKAGACCAGYIGLIWLSCLAFVRLLPEIGGLFTEDELVLGFLSSLSRARVLPGLWAPILLCSLLFLLLFLRERRQKARGIAPKKALPVWFYLTLGLSFLPAILPALYFARLNLVPVRVIINFVKMVI